MKIGHFKSDDIISCIEKKHSVYVSFVCKGIIWEWSIKGVEQDALHAQLAIENFRLANYIFRYSIDAN